MIRLTPGQSKAAALGLLGLVLVLALSIVIVPLVALHRHYDEAIDDAVSHLERYSKIANMRDGLQKKIAEARALRTSSYFLKSASPALVAAEIQDTAKKIVEASGGKLASMQILPHKDEGSHRQVSVTLQLTASLDATKKILYQLETSEPYLFIDNLSIRSPMAAMVRRPGVEPELVVQFDLTGYALKGTP